MAVVETGLVLFGGVALGALLFGRGRRLGRGHLFGSSRAELDEVRRRQALQIQDDVIQSLVTAKLAFEMDDPERGIRSLEESLISSRRIVSELLGDGEGIAPGSLRREGP